MIKDSSSGHRNEIEHIKALAELAKSGVISNKELMNQMGLSPMVDQTAMSAADIHHKLEKQLDQLREYENKVKADQEYREAYNRERMEALKTLFPRGHNAIQDIDKMVDIAREDQLNPLYEQVLKDFEDAKLNMSRAANKLAQAVKLTDSDKLEEMKKAERETVYGMGYKGATGPTGNIGSVGIPGNLVQGQTARNTASASQSWHTTLNNGVTMSAGPMGATGATGPKGDKGDPGVDGKRGPWFGEWLWNRITGR